MPKKVSPPTKKKSPITSNKVSRKLNKRLGLPAPVLTLVEITPEKVKTQLSKILSDKGLVKLINERAAIGCSLGSIAATLQVPYGVFQSWVLTGREESSKYDPEFAKTDEMELWGIISDGWGKARTVCEGMVMQTNPEKFLTSKASKLLGDDWVEENVAVDENSTSMKLDMGLELIDTLKALRAQHVDLNEVIDQDKLSLRVTPGPKKATDVLEAHNLLPTKNCSLPAIFQTQVETLPVPIDKTTS